MGMTKKAREYQEKMGTDMLSALLETDPEFAERFADLSLIHISEPTRPY